MNAIVQLVNEAAPWFETHPESDLENFCRYYLSKKEDLKRRPHDDRANGIGQLLRVMGRITSAFALYHRAALKETSIPFPDAFFYLNALAHLGEARKTTVINYLFAEYTTGMEAISRLESFGLIEEKSDPTDKRAKLIKLTSKGKKLVSSCYELTTKAAALIFQGVDEDSIRLCHQLLKDIEVRHSAFAMNLKTEDFETIRKQINAKNF